MSSKGLLKNKSALMGLVLIAIEVLIAVFATSIATHDPYAQDLTKTLLPPGQAGFFLGTDEFGRDVFSRLVLGSRISLQIGLSALVVALCVGVPLGLLSGFYQQLDGLIMRFVDIFLAFPGILVALLLATALGRSLLSLTIAVGITSFPLLARVVRGAVLSIRNEEYVLAAKSAGASDHRIILLHVLPNCIGAIVVQGSFIIASAILTASALSFLGLGPAPPTAEWGAMLSRGRTYVFTASHLMVFPGLAIFYTVLSFNLLGDGLRDMLDPRLKGIV